MEKKFNNDFKVRVKQAMDLIMNHSVCKSFAIAACAVSADDALVMLKYINDNL